MSRQVDPGTQLASIKRGKELAAYYPALEIEEIPDTHYGTRTVLRCTDCGDYSRLIEYVNSGCRSCGYTYLRMQQGSEP